MGRVNRFTTGVFTTIVGNLKEIPAFNRFLDVQELLKKPSKELIQYLDAYKSNIDKNKQQIELMAKLEDVIMQIRSRDNLKVTDIKLNVVREYIYARISFHRKDKETKDIRVIVGQTDEYGTDVQILLGNKAFVKIAKQKLIAAMDEVINESALLLKEDIKQLN